MLKLGGDWKVMEKVITPEEARKIDLPLLPWRRNARIRELAEPLGGLGMGHKGNLLVDLRPTKLYDIPTRKRLVDKATRVQIDKGINNLAQQQGIEDPKIAELAYCVGRLFGYVNPDGTLQPEEPRYELSPETIAMLRANYAAQQQKQD